jgi:hypothetical protein
MDNLTKLNEIILEYLNESNLKVIEEGNLKPLLSNNLALTIYLKFNELFTDIEEIKL